MTIESKIQTVFLLRISQLAPMLWGIDLVRSVPHCKNLLGHSDYHLRHLSMFLHCITSTLSHGTLSMLAVKLCNSFLGRSMWASPTVCNKEESTRDVQLVTCREWTCLTIKGQGLLWLPAPAEGRLTCATEKSFSLVARQVWDSFPRDVCLAPSLGIFRRHIPSHDVIYFTD